MPMTTQPHKFSNHRDLPLSPISPGSDELPTITECLDPNVCPVPAQEQFGNEIWNCAEAFCFDTSKTDANACNNYDGTYHKWWDEAKASGAGLCKVSVVAGRRAGILGMNRRTSNILAISFVK